MRGKEYLGNFEDEIVKKRIVLCACMGG